MQKRMSLINLIENQGYGVTQAARQLRMKIPTAKAILYLYRNQKRIFVKKDDPSIRKQLSEVKAPEVKEITDVPAENQNQNLNGIIIPEPFISYPMFYWIPFPNQIG
jgi:hypothetical protein